MKNYPEEVKTYEETFVRMFHSMEELTEQKCVMKQEFKNEITQQL